MTYKPKVIEISDYWLNGGDMIKRDTLPPDHPENPYNFIKRVWKVNPEDYGIFKPHDPNAPAKGIQ